MPLKPILSAATFYDLMIYEEADIYKYNYRCIIRHCDKSLALIRLSSQYRTNLLDTRACESPSDYKFVPNVNMYICSSCISSTYAANRVTQDIICIVTINPNPSMKPT